MKSDPFPLASLKVNESDVWFYIVQISDISGIENKVLEYIQAYPELSFVKDRNNRVAVDMATPTNKSVITSVFLWFNRYRVTETRPEHISATCLVFKAFDEEDRDDAGNPRPVALKLLRYKTHFLREIQCRSVGFEQEFVVDIIKTFPSTPEEIESWPDCAGIDAFTAVNTLTKKQADSFFCLVMPLGHRNMFVAMKQERFAGTNFEEIRHVFSQLVRCTAHMHQRGIIHADIKPLNVVRIDDKWKLIDLDASCRIGVDTVGIKSSSAYIAPEILYADNSSKTVVVKSEKYVASGLITASDLVVASPAVDVWSLGCILYQLCNAEVRPLLQGGQDDNLSSDESEEDSLWLLAEWKSDVKTKKLSRVKDPLGRNLLAQMLNRDPAKRPTLQRILSHPFLSGAKVSRLVGEKAQFDVFVSYRVASDSFHVELLYNLLCERGLRVWWDRKCLKPGVEWKEGFCAGLANSNAFVCLLSKGAINHPEKSWQNFSKLTADSKCDNVFLEHRLALELKGLGLISKIFPMFIGEVLETHSTSESVQYTDFFASNGMPALPDIAVKAVEEDLCHHLESQALGSPLEVDKTVRSVVSAITAFQGAFIKGEMHEAFRQAADYIVKMIRESIESEE